MQDVKEMAETNYERYAKISKRVLEFFMEEAKEKRKKEAKKKKHRKKDPKKEVRSDPVIEQSASGDQILRL